MNPDERRSLHEYYERGLELDRLDDGVGAVEYAPTKEIVTRHLPPERLHDPLHAQVVFETARALERVPELLGIGPHLIATARRPPHPQ